MGLSLREIFTFRNTATFLLILLCIRYIPLETRSGASIIKTGVSILCAVALFINPPKITKALVWGGLYFVNVLFCAYLHTSFRWSTILYLLSFLIIYLYFYNSLYVYNAFSLDFFIRLVRWLILAYAIVLIIQQLALIVGIRYMPLINLVQFLDRDIGANSLSGEPSSAARIMATAFLCMIRAYEIKYNRKISISELFQVAKWPCIGFFWSMCTMGSGTAFVALPIVLLYFVRKQYLIIFIPLVFLIPTIVSVLDFTPLQRAYNAAEVTLTMDNAKIIENDGSAASRITPLVNTVTKLDLFSIDTWFGNGIDASSSHGGYYKRMKYGILGCIEDYGFLSFIIMQIFIYSCVIKKIFSLETILWILLFSMSFSNVSYVWGVMMLLTSVQFFQCKYANLIE